MAKVSKRKVVASTGDKPYTVEYYYKVRWGHADEFLRLYRKNHLPVMKKEIEMGRIVELTIARPRFHATEDARWDFRVTIVWKNIQTTNDGFSEPDLARRLFPDQTKFYEEEKRRFEILEAHWDVPVVEVPTEG
ncbi:MAG TPA: hypothetical protein VIS48_16235 [Candidatus Kryptonia bacterium]